MDEDFQRRLIEKVYPSEMQRLKQFGIDRLEKDEVLGIGTFGGIVLPKGNKNYYITNTVHNLLSLIKVNKLDWSIFSKYNERKYTFIFAQSRLLRIVFRDTSIDFFCLFGRRKGR